VGAFTFLGENKKLSHNSKKSRQVSARKQMSSTRKGGGKGPAKTQKLHRKRNTWYARLDGKVTSRQQQQEQPQDVGAAATED
jgi:hypothetical protein